MRWLPRIECSGMGYSDGLGPDAEGGSLTVTWGRLVLQVSFAWRDAQ